jgi:hypothetical protein
MARRNCASCWNHAATRLSVWREQGPVVPALVVGVPFGDWGVGDLLSVLGKGASTVVTVAVCLGCFLLSVCGLFTLFFTWEEVRARGVGK